MPCVHQEKLNVQDNTAHFGKQKDREKERIKEDRKDINRVKETKM